MDFSLRICMLSTYDVNSVANIKPDFTIGQCFVDDTPCVANVSQGSVIVVFSFVLGMLGFCHVDSFRLFRLLSLVKSGTNYFQDSGM